ncbi:hypothetical protein G3O08_01510 [Cryomorpha ignava]|uniref:Stationary phase survival protein SurE n=1 Tax=Cryomorpha ignava TaxID=101383 RepID=A0A7K3WKL8_9FLAO|nr:hypothetical protein [Cryomorpha ignava]NEN22179.1 hypothetical protein [Cryomorpha ignava]
MKSKRFDKTAIGFVIGLILPVIGFVIYGVYWSWKFFRTFSYFVNDVFLGTPTFRSSILSLSLLINLIPFFIFLKTDRNKSARGVLAAVFVYVPFVVYFKFF